MIGPWPRLMTEADRAAECIEVMPADRYERMMGIARRAFEDRQKLKMENRRLAAAVEDWRKALGCGTDLLDQLADVRAALEAEVKARREAEARADLYEAWYRRVRPTIAPSARDYLERQ